MTQPSDEVPVLIGHDSVGGSIGVTLGSLLMLLVSLNILLLDWTAGQPPGWIYQVLPRQVFGVLFTLLFGTTTALGVRGLFGRPRVILDHEGIHDLSGWRRSLLIPWESVVAVTPRGRRYVEIEIADSQVVLSGASWMRRLSYRMAALFGRGFLRFRVGGENFGQEAAVDRIESGIDGVELRRLGHRGDTTAALRGETP